MWVCQMFALGRFHVNGRMIPLWGFTVGQFKLICYESATTERIFNHSQSHSPNPPPHLTQCQISCANFALVRVFMAEDLVFVFNNFPLHHTIVSRFCFYSVFFIIIYFQYLLLPQCVCVCAYIFLSVQCSYVQVNFYTSRHVFLWCFYDLYINTHTEREQPKRRVLHRTSFSMSRIKAPFERAQMLIRHH